MLTQLLCRPFLQYIVLFLSEVGKVVELFVDKDYLLVVASMMSGNQCYCIFDMRDLRLEIIHELEVVILLG
jgi:hypothetical protein